MTQEEFIRELEQQPFYAEFEDIQLKNMELSDRTLHKVKIYRSHLSNVTFTDTKIEFCCFEKEGDKLAFHNCQLHNSDIKGKFKNIVFNKSKIKSTYFTGEFDSVTFIDCKIESIWFKEGTTVNNLVMENSIIRDAILDNVKLPGANFRNARFAGNVNLSKTDISGADFTNALIDHSLIQKVKAIGTVFDSMKFNKYEFKDTDLRQATFRKANLKGLEFIKVNLEGTDFTSADLRGTVFKNCINGEKAVFTGVKTDEKTQLPGSTPEKLVKPKGTKSLDKSAFINKHGEIKEDTYLNELLNQCTYLPGESDDDLPYEEWPKIFNGQFYNIGFFRNDINLDTIELDWGKLSKDLELAKKLEKLLEGTCESSDSDISYSGFVLPVPFDMDFDVLDGMGMEEDNEELDNAVELEYIDEDNAFIENYDEEELEEYFSKGALKAFKKAGAFMQKNLTDVSWYLIRTETQIVFPVIRVGRSATGNFVGVFATRTET